MKTTITKFFIIIVLLTLCRFCVVKAQAIKPVSKITGSVLDDKAVAMPFATVALLRAKDSTLIKGTITSEAGSYVFNQVGLGNYVIKVTVMGFAAAKSKVIMVTQANMEINVLPIHLGNAAKTLKEVNITSAKPLIERKLDRTVLNVENSTLAAGNSAMEILERAPGVSIDKDDNISLRGKQGVTVMIDGKLTYLSAAQLATLLRSTDGNTIKSIEIITNPSAKYDAAGNSGIINIILKKNKTTGTNGSISLTGAYGNYPKSNELITLNHKDGGLNIFGSFSHGNRERDNDLEIDRIITDPVSGANTYYAQHSFMPKINYDNTYRLGADYDITKKNTIGFLVNGFFNGETDNIADNTLINSQPNVLNSYQNTNSTMDQTYHNFALNLNDRYNIDTTGQQLTVDLDYSRFSNTNNANYGTYFFLPDGSTQAPPSFIRNQSPSVIKIFTAKADYVKPFSKTLKFETGFKVSDVKTDNDLDAQILTNNIWINDTTRTNRFIYDEKIFAGYINLSQTWKKTSVQAGLRAENTNSNGDLVTTNNVVNRNYLNFFPSLFINQTLNDKNELGFSYSRRIDRPSYDNLNPFIFYLDQFTYAEGNPFLNPQYTQSFEFNYTYNKSINTSIGYSHTSNAITQVLLPQGNITYQTTLNLQTQNSYNVNINAPYTFTKWWSGNANLNGFYLHFISANLPGNINLNDGQLAFQFKTVQTLTFLKTFKAELSTEYDSPLTVALLKIQKQYWADGGISHSFADKKANVKFSLSDIFNTRIQHVTSDYTGQQLAITQKNETRIARLTLTYNFGNSKIKASQHNTNSEEKSRVKTGN